MKGTLNVMLDTALKDCTKAIELSDSPQSILDSRAMVYFRMNRFEDALSRSQRARSISIRASPRSMYMRGVVRKRMGDAKASEGDLAAARMMTPADRPHLCEVRDRALTAENRVAGL